jgi:hypothetical protein
MNDTGIIPHFPNSLESSGSLNSQFDNSDQNLINLIEMELDGPKANESDQFNTSMTKDLVGKHFVQPFMKNFRLENG